MSVSNKLFNKTITNALDIGYHGNKNAITTNSNQSSKTSNRVCDLQLMGGHGNGELIMSPSDQTHINMNQQNSHHSGDDNEDDQDISSGGKKRGRKRKAKSPTDTLKEKMDAAKRIQKLKTIGELAVEYDIKPDVIINHSHLNRHSLSSQSLSHFNSKSVSESHRKLISHHDSSLSTPCSPSFSPSINHNIHSSIVEKSHEQSHPHSLSHFPNHKSIVCDHEDDMINTRMRLNHVNNIRMNEEQRNISESKVELMQRFLSSTSSAHEERMKKKNRRNNNSNYNDSNDGSLLDDLDDDVQCLDSPEVPSPSSLPSPLNRLHSHHQQVSSPSSEAQQKTSLSLTHQTYSSSNHLSNYPIVASTVTSNGRDQDAQDIHGKSNGHLDDRVITDCISQEINHILSQLPPLDPNDLEWARHFSFDNGVSEDHEEDQVEQEEKPLKNVMIEKGNSRNSNTCMNGVDDLLEVIDDEDDDEVMQSDSHGDGDEDDDFANHACSTSASNKKMIVSEIRDESVEDQVQREQEKESSGVVKLLETKWENVNGTYDGDTDWREWSDMTNAVSYNGELLHILPYVNIDW